MILLVQIAVLAYLRNYESKFDPPDEHLVSSLLASIKSEEDAGPETGSNEAGAHIDLIPFDPNKLNAVMSKTSGLSDRQSKVIMNYLAKGGVFRTKKDFKKMYCIDEAQYHTLEPFLLLPDSFVKPDFKKKAEKRNSIVDIATADSASLLSIRGIGPVFASRIIKYRDKLGGFYSVEQLLEVWGMKDSLLKIISPYVILKDTIPFRRLSTQHRRANANPEGRHLKRQASCTKRHNLYSFGCLWLQYSFFAWQNNCRRKRPQRFSAFQRLP